MHTEYISFKDLTTFRVGGNIRSTLFAENTQDICSIINESTLQHKKVVIIGGGSNILPSDDFFDGVVLVVRTRAIEFIKETPLVRVIADAGLSWDELVVRSIEEQLWGFENLSGIPGTVGAAPIQNIGAYGADVSKTIEWVEVYDRHEKKISRLLKNALHFDYRSSFLKTHKERYAVLRVCFVLSREGVPNIAYKDLQKHFNEHTPTLQEIREAVLAIRKMKFPDLNEFGTAGSFFMNPIVDELKARALVRRYPDLPTFKHHDGMKLSLAWIMDHVVGAKGMRVGGASVWNEQPLVLVAERDTKAIEVKMLAEVLEKKVFEHTSIKIIPEVNIF